MIFLELLNNHFMSVTISLMIQWCSGKPTVPQLLEVSFPLYPSRAKKYCISQCVPFHLLPSQFISGEGFNSYMSCALQGLPTLRLSLSANISGMNISTILFQRLLPGSFLFHWFASVSWKQRWKVACRLLGKCSYEIYLEMKKAGVAGRQKELLTYNVVLIKTSKNHTLESCPKLR